MKDAQRQIDIVVDPIPESDLFGQGVCFKPRPEGASVDTIIIHSCYVDDSIITPAIGVSAPPSAESLQSTLEEWLAGKKVEAAIEDPSEKQICSEKNQQLECLALHHLIHSRRGHEGLSTYCKDSIKDIFQFYGVSAHYVIDREGAVFEFVAPEYLAFHAGKSQMPRPEDGRAGVNAFSVGIELLGTKTSGYSEQQYAALAGLTRHLMDRFSIQNIYGHSDIALGRKTDPENFDWLRFKSELASRSGERELHFPV